MKIDILAGGSSGNCIAIRSSKSTILIDAGVPKTKIEKRLLDVGIRPDNIDAIFITHAHSDHVKGLPLANKYKIPVFAAKDEWQSIQDLDNSIIHYIDDSECIPFKDISITSFRVHHDAIDPRGYVVDIGKEKIAVCLDTGHIDTYMLEAMKNSDVYIIEANHEPALVELCKYPNSVKTRILSDVGHLSNEQTAEALAHLVNGKGEKILITHLSTSNNRPAIVEATIMKYLKKKGLKRSKDYELEVF